ncbi:uncharacterized protein LOC110189317 [Drosophila serrata]|uniref:uncharacterized protein LOC110189317 n=1 Tax=Drosophila serrata TaxID=7274 RepID=UPI000A1D25A8|nr:uncharacterized protein LOC110189317 [Drosophila serrata]
MFGTLLLLFIFGVTRSWAVDYEMLIEDPDIFSPCTEGPPDSITVQEAFNFDDLTISMESDTLHVSGNATVKWEAQPTDKIVVQIDILHFNRGFWEPTVFSMSTQDFCASMYDKNQYWFKYWTTFITNRDEVESQCLATGTFLVHEPFDVRFKMMNYRGPELRGRYKMVITIKALHKKLPRPSSICMEIRGEVFKA